MTPKRKYILAGTVAAVLGLAAAGAVAHRGGDWGGPGRGHGWRHHGGSMGLMGFGGLGGPLGKLCRGDPAEMVDHMLVRIEHKVKPTETQKGAFEEFKVAARTAADKIKGGCPPDVAAENRDGDKAGLSPIERLARAEAQLEASLAAVKTVRPAAEKFYATLDEAQKTKLTERRGWRAKRAERGPRERDGADAPAAGDPPAKDDAPPARE